MTEAPLAPDELARKTFARNLAALEEPLRSRVSAAADAVASEAQWVYGRDGSLTARTPGGWLGGSGLPGRVAEKLTADVDLSRGVPGLVSPGHGRQLTAMLGRLARRPGAGLLAFYDDALGPAWALHCVDVADALVSGRLAFVAGPDVGEALTLFLRREPGRVFPKTLFRAGDVSDTGLTDRVREALAGLLEQSRHLLTAAARRPADPDGPVVVVAGSGFSPWQDAGDVLWGVARVTAGPVRRVDPDKVAFASPASIGLAAEGARGVLTADLLRSDLPPVVHPQMPWTTWVSAARTPVAPTSADDRIILADPEWAHDWRDAGWLQEQIHTAGWPQRVGPSSTGQGVILVEDLPDATPPPEVQTYSSRLLVWNATVEELSRDPLALVRVGGLRPYLHDRASRVGVKLSPADADCFRVAVVAGFVRGVGMLVARKNVKIFGRGWEAVPAVARVWGGAVTDPRHLRDLLVGARAVVGAFPDEAGRPALRGCGRPLLHACGWKNPAQLDATFSRIPAEVASGRALTADLLERLAARPRRRPAA